MITELSWDSAFFGVKIARIDIDEASDLDAVDDAMADRGIRCLYAYVAGASTPTLAHALQERGYRIVDTAVTLDAPVGDECDVTVPVRTIRSADVPRLGPVLDDLVPWSRFSADPAFGASAARRMYEAWLARAAQTQTELCAVAVDGDEPTGLVTAVCAPLPQLGLFGVAVPGRGTGSCLIHAAKLWASRHYDRLCTVTQARNAAALSFYETHGFRTVASTTILHHWV